MKKALLLALCLAYAACDSKDSRSFPITRFRLYSDEGTILLDVRDAPHRFLVIQGLRSSGLRGYAETLQKGGNSINELQVTLTTNQHSYSNGNIDYDQLIIATAVPGNAEIYPRFQLDWMLPLGSSRFISRDDLREPPTVDLPVANGKVELTTSSGRHAGPTPDPGERNRRGAGP